MNLVSYYTKSHKELLDILLKSSEQIENKIIFQGGQICSSAKFREDGWNLSTSQKIKMLSGISADNNLYFFSDADVVLADDFEDWCNKFASDKPDDFIFYGYDTFQWCTGTMLFRQTESVKRWWSAVYEICKVIGQNDQDGLHILRSSGRLPFLMDFLPRENVCNLATLSFPQAPQIWDGQEFSIPATCKAWHSNWTLGVEQKTKMCNMAYEKMRNK
jgi:hypothetical protein